MEDSRRSSSHLNCLDAALTIMFTTCAAVVAYYTGEPVAALVTAIVGGYIAINRRHTGKSKC